MNSINTLRNDLEALKLLAIDINGEMKVNAAQTIISRIESVMSDSEPESGCVVCWENNTHKIVELRYCDYRNAYTIPVKVIGKRCSHCESPV